MYESGTDLNGTWAYFSLHRRAIAYKTSLACEVPHVGGTLDFDVTDILAFVADLAQSPEFEGIHVSLNSVMLKIIAESLKKSPAMNAHVHYNRNTGVGDITLCHDVNIAVPVFSPGTPMITPVLRRADKKSLREICIETADIRRRVKNTNFDMLLLAAARRERVAQLKKWRLGALRKLYANLFGKARIRLPSREEIEAYQRIPETDRLTEKDLADATTVVSNIGSVAPQLRCRVSLIAVIPPATTAIALAGVRKQPVVLTGEDGVERIAIRHMMPLTLSFDHRALDFDHLLGFLNELAAFSANPQRLVEPLAVPASP